MRDDEARAFGAACAQALDGVATVVQDIHRTIAGRSWKALGPPAAPVRAVHDAVSAGVYATVRSAGHTAGRLGGAAVGATRSPGAASCAEGARGGALLGAVNGAFGDTLHARHGALSAPLAVRRDGRDVLLTPAALRSAFPGARPRVAVFLHGLGETERSWNRRPAAHGRGPRASFPTLLEADLGISAVVLRCNTGLPVERNGAALDVLLEQLCAAWPVRLRELSLVGHSMGGLIARSACRHGQDRGRRWVERVTHIVLLGTPHRGAPLERAAHRLTTLLGGLPETRPLARLADVRSAGVKDLRDGVEAGDGHALAAYCVSATLGGHEDHLLGRLLGDVLVPRASATGADHPRRAALRFVASRHFVALNHFDLLNHPAVYEQLRRWLTARQQRLLDPGATPALLGPGGS